MGGKRTPVPTQITSIVNFPIEIEYIPCSVSLEKQQKSLQSASFPVSLLFLFDLFKIIRISVRSLLCLIYSRASDLQAVLLKAGGEKMIMSSISRGKR